MPPIKGQSILVIGGSSGIGAGVAKLAAAEGASIAIASSNPSRVDSAVKGLEALFPDSQITGHVCDLRKDAIESVIEKLFGDVTAGGTQLLDHVVFTAGIIDVKQLQEADLEYLRSAGQLALYAPLLIAKLAPRYLKASYTSSLIFCGGVVGEKPQANYTIPAGFAAGLFGLTRALALELAPLRVNMVSPGPTQTELWGPEPGRAQRAEAIAKRLLLGKVGTPEEVGEAFLYLMKDTNTTGTCVSTSGGVLLQ